MIIEALLSFFMRRQARRRLRFSELGRAITGPPPPASRQNLLYLHVPYCEGLCEYCSFNRVRLDGGQAPRYFAALRSEMRLYHESGYRFDQVYVGGGTPTILPGELERVLRLARELWPVRSISVEANPSLSPSTLDLLVDCGVDRLSIGVQTFNNGLLRAMQRLQRYGSGADIRRSLEAAQGRFATLNVDLIFNFAEQTEGMFRRDLQLAAALAPDQITCYPLMAPRPLRGSLAREKRFYRLIRESLDSRYRPATAWCFSRKDNGRRKAEPLDEYIVSREEYAGMGSGSFGYLGGRLYANTFSLPQYIEALDRGAWPVAASRDFSRRDRLRYDFLMKLFTGRLDLRMLEARHGAEAGSRLAPEIALFRSLGALRREGRSLVLTDEGYYVWVVLMREFFSALNRLRAACRAAGK